MAVESGADSATGVPMRPGGSPSTQPEGSGSRPNRPGSSNGGADVDFGMSPGSGKPKMGKGKGKWKGKNKPGRKPKNGKWKRKQRKGRKN